MLAKRNSELKHTKLNVAAVIFDLDGTLLDSIGVYFKLIKTVFDKLDLPQASIERLREASKNGEFEWDQILTGMSDTRKEQIIQDAWKIIADIYPEMFSRNLRLIRGAARAVKNMASKGIKMGIVTSTPRENIRLKMPPLVDSGISGLLPVIIASEDAPRKKPAADPLLACCARLGIEPEKSVYVGDFRIDIQAGKAAGMKTVGVLTGFDDFKALSRESPDAILDSVSDMPEIIEGSSPKLDMFKNNPSFY
jgi:HAD superfamily hydrolase (TIGR01509 family)